MWWSLRDEEEGSVNTHSSNPPSRYHTPSQSYDLTESFQQMLTSGWNAMIGAGEEGSARLEVVGAPHPLAAHGEAQTPQLARAQHPQGEVIFATAIEPLAIIDVAGDGEKDSRVRGRSHSDPLSSSVDLITRSRRRKSSGGLNLSSSKNRGKAPDFVDAIESHEKEAQDENEHDHDELSESSEMDWMREVVAELSVNQGRFRGLRLMGLDGHFIPFNSTRPVPFRTPGFQGHLLFLVNPGHDSLADQYTPHLQDRKFHFEMRVQGQFTSVPEGLLYMGAELPRHIQLNMLLRNATKMIMAVGSTYVKGLHYSLGEGEKEIPPHQHEAAHCTWPWFSGVDRLVITPEGQTPPSLYHPIPETNEERTIRRGKVPQSSPLQLGPTYTFSFASGLLDPVRWQFKNGKASLDMRTFISDLPLQIVVYDLANPSSSSSSPPGAAATTTAGEAMHRSSAKRYYFFAELSTPTSSTAHRQNAPSLAPLSLLPPRQRRVRKEQQIATIAGTTVSSSSSPPLLSVSRSVATTEKGEGEDDEAIGKPYPSNLTATPFGDIARGQPRISSTAHPKAIVQQAIPPPPSAATNVTIFPAGANSSSSTTTTIRAMARTRRALSPRVVKRIMLVCLGVLLTGILSFIFWSHLVKIAEHKGQITRTLHANSS